MEVLYTDQSAGRQGWLKMAMVDTLHNQTEAHIITSTAARAQHKCFMINEFSIKPQGDQWMQADVMCPSHAAYGHVARSFQLNLDTQICVSRPFTSTASSEFTHHCIICVFHFVSVTPLCEWPGAAAIFLLKQLYSNFYWEVLSSGICNKYFWSSLIIVWIVSAWSAYVRHSSWLTAQLHVQSKQRHMQRKRCW